MPDNPSAGAQPHRPVSLLDENELRIEIYPRGYDCWRGTRAQLQAEGMIPEGLEWPRHPAQKCWLSGPFFFRLIHLESRGPKGSTPPVPEVERWACRRSIFTGGEDNFSSARIYEISQMLAREIWRRTPAARAQWDRYWKAHQDRRFQAFKALFVPQPKKRGRPSRSKTAT